MSKSARGDEKDAWLRRQAIQIVGMLPEQSEDAAQVLSYAQDAVARLASDTRRRHQALQVAGALPEDPGEAAKVLSYAQDLLNFANPTRVACVALVKSDRSD